MQPTLYREALAELRRVHGSRCVIVAACNSAIDNLKPFFNNDYAGLGKLSSTLRSVVAELGPTSMLNYVPIRTSSRL